MTPEKPAPEAGTAPRSACPLPAQTSAAATPPTAPPEPVTWTVDGLDELQEDPVLAESLRCPGMQRVRLPHGEEPAWLAGRYEDVTRVTSDPRFSRQALLGRSVTRLAPHAIPLPDAVGFADPPEHTRLRRAASAVFAARRVDLIEVWARQRADALLDRMTAGEAPAELVASLTTPFALDAISEVVGVPEGDRPQVAEWTGLIISARQSRERSERAKAEMEEYVTALFRRPRADGDGDLLAHLKAEVEREALSEAEAIALTELIQISGMNAVRLHSSQIFYVLLTRPALAARLRAEPETIPRAVEELLRWIPHRNAVGQARIALEPVTVGGVDIPAGEPVYASYLAANHDPAVFPRPEEIDFDRSPNPHLAFGHGPHYCVGAPLARLELRTLVARVVDRLPGLRLAVPADEVRWRRGELIRGPVALPVAW